MPKLPSETREPWQSGGPKKNRNNNRAQSKNRKIYDSGRWRNLRKRKLNEEPLCRICWANNRTIPATVLDHITPINQGGDPWEDGNLQPLCESCHARKSNTERT